MECIECKHFDWNNIRSLLAPVDLKTFQQQNSRTCLSFSRWNHLYNVTFVKTYMQLKSKCDLKFRYKILYLIIGDISSLNSCIFFYPMIGDLLFSPYKNLFTVHNINHKIRMLLAPWKLLPNRFLWATYF